MIKVGKLQNFHAFNVKIQSNCNNLLKGQPKTNDLLYKTISNLVKNSFQIKICLMFR